MRRGSTVPSRRLRTGDGVTGQTLVGRTGSVITRVRGGDLPGEVKVVVGGLPHYYVAYCTQPVPVGATVLVIHARGARLIDVEPWNGPTITTDRT
jgi:membrane protein implicated in regulation of membrane protease activity